jgi:predicted lipid-binding transport protein (Tim44 family)
MQRWLDAGSKASATLAVVSGCRGAVRRKRCGLFKPEERSMKTWMVGALVVIMAAVSVPQVADAKRLGAGKSSGMQRDMPARTAPDAPPAKPATPSQASPAVPGAAAAGTAAAAGKRSWLGPIAGLAAGLGLAALMSHLGLGEGFANFLMLALLAVAAFFLIRFLMRRFAGTPAPSRSPMQYAGQTAGGSVSSGGSSGGSGPGSVAWPAPAGGGSPAPSSTAALPAAETVQDAPALRTVTQAFVPATFDSEGFGRIAKMIFIRLQAANDARNLDDLRSFTTPEMYAAIKLDLQDRGDLQQHTDVVRVDAQVLDVAEEDGRQIVSVRFHGLIKEDETAAQATPFDEVWHLVKPLDDSRNWAIAGIEQAAGQPG